LPDEKRYAILAMLQKNPSVTMAEIARVTGIPYPSVRMSLQYLQGKDSGQARIMESEDKKIAERVGPLLRGGMTYAAVKRVTGYGQQRIQSAGRRLGRKDLMKTVTVIKHGTAVAYGHHGCRCLECVSFNSARAKSLYQDRKARAATDAPHGTETGYRNWGCRCRPCIDAGNVSNKAALTVPDLDKFRDHMTWSLEEEEQILSYDQTARQLAVKLGRGVSAINLRRSGMWIDREPAAVLSSN
jgi:DNA-binding transcriptional ArsR family regulator